MLLGQLSKRQPQASNPSALVSSALGPWSSRQPTDEFLVIGAVFYQIGYTAIILLVEVTIGDTTSLRSRLFFSYIPALPFLVSWGFVSL